MLSIVEKNITSLDPSITLFFVQFFVLKNTNVPLAETIISYGVPLCIKRFVRVACVKAETGESVTHHSWLQSLDSFEKGNPKQKSAA